MISQRVMKALANPKHPFSAEKVNLQQALANVVEAAEEHVECDPSMIGNECVGLGGADGLIESLRELEHALKDVGV